MGLDGLQDLLGRLNGKNEEQLGKEVESREKLRREVIVGERYGMRFVRGETYVSSDIEALLKRIEGEKDIKKEGESDGELVKAEDIGSSSVRAKKEKKEKKSKRERSSSKSASATPAPNTETDSKESSKKRKRTDDDNSSKIARGKMVSKEKKVPKMSKKSRNGETREERRARRERRRREKEARKAGKGNKKRKSSSDSDSSDDEESAAPSGVVTPSYPALVGRQAVRHRYIAAKRSAVMDAKALNEVCVVIPVLFDLFADWLLQIFMIKA